MEVNHDKYSESKFREKQNIMVNEQVVLLTRWSLYRTRS